MVERLALGHAVVMAAQAGDWCAFENAALVAGFAIHLNVRTFQWHARVAVIKILVNLKAVLVVCWAAAGLDAMARTSHRLATKATNTRKRIFALLFNNQLYSARRADPNNVLNRSSTRYFSSTIQYRRRWPCRHKLVGNRNAPSFTRFFERLALTRR